MSHTKQQESSVELLITAKNPYKFISERKKWIQWHIDNTPNFNPDKYYPHLRAKKKTRNRKPKARNPYKYRTQYTKWVDWRDENDPDFRGKHRLSRFNLKPHPVLSEPKRIIKEAEAEGFDFNDKNRRNLVHFFRKELIHLDKTGEKGGLGKDKRKLMGYDLISCPKLRGRMSLTPLCKQLLAELKETSP